MKSSKFRVFQIGVLLSFVIHRIVAQEVTDQSPANSSPPKMQYVLVFGEVLKPDRYRWTNGITFLDALESAGGYSAFGAYTKIEIRRPGVSTNLVDYAEVLQTPSKNPRLNPGDAVFIPQSSTKAAMLYVAPKLGRNNVAELSGAGNWVRVRGAVKQPGKFTWKEGMTPFDAIELAGGVTGVSDIERARVVHYNGGSETEDMRKAGKFDLKSIVLSQGDTVIIPMKEDGK